MRKALVALGLAALLSTSSCIGPYNLFNGAVSWNGRATESRFVNELLFLGMWIIPVYPITLAGDGLIFNTIEFWGGENPIGPPEPFQNQSEK